MKAIAKGGRSRRGKFALGFLFLSLLAAGSGVLAIASSHADRSKSGISVGAGLDLLSRAKIAFADREFAEAERLAREAGDAGRTLLGRILLERGRLVEARELFAQLLKQNPESHEALRGMGLVLKGLGQAEAALAYLEKAARLKNSPEDWKSLGLLQRERGDSLGALTSLQQSLKLDPQQGDVNSLITDLVTGKDALAGTSPGLPRGFGHDPMNPRPIDPETLIPRPRAPDPTQHFPKPSGRNR